MSSKPPARCSVDTVVLLYFSLSDQLGLLAQLLGTLGIPRVVFDPDEDQRGDVDSKSEITRSINYYERVAGDLRSERANRVQAAESAARLQRIRNLWEVGDLEILDLADEERLRFGELTDPDGVQRFALAFPLQAGEAACVAIAEARSWVLVTDDSDALKAMKALDPSAPYERIRRLLIRAAESEGLITPAEANDIHAEMRRRGFWDTVPPFPVS